MLGLLVAAAMLYGYAKFLAKATSVVLCMIAICAALINQAVQPYLPGPTGLGASLLISGFVVVFIAKGVRS